MYLFIGKYLPVYYQRILPPSVHISAYEYGEPRHYITPIKYAAKATIPHHARMAIRKKIGLFIFLPSYNLEHGRQDALVVFSCSSEGSFTQNEQRNTKISRPASRYSSDDQTMMETTDGVAELMVNNNSIYVVSGILCHRK